MEERVELAADSQGGTQLPVRDGSEEHARVDWARRLATARRLFSNLLRVVPRKMPVEVRGAAPGARLQAGQAHVKCDT